MATHRVARPRNGNFPIVRARLAQPFAQNGFGLFGIRRNRPNFSDRGKIQAIDSTLDRFVEVFALLGFVVFLRATPYGAFCAAAAMAGSLLVSYARARGESLGVLCKEGLMQRAERLVLTILVCWLDRAVSAWWGLAVGTPSAFVLGLIAVGTFGTAIQRTAWIARRL
jgi:phosphatidylglycerophosphate synthase